MEIHALTLSDVVKRVKSGELTVQRVAEAMLDRIECLDGRFGAFVAVLGEQALERAHALDAKRQRGEPLGVLHGAPIALKDLLATAGFPAMCGTQVLASWQPGYNATVVERLQAAGALVLGKVKLTEGAYAEHHPSVSPPLNPWRADRWVGASSSGSGVAVAAGLAHGAIGTDTGGSIRFPSAACGLVGLKPTYGRVSRYGVFPLAESLDHVGPMTRRVEDAARMFQAMAGHDPLDATSLQAPVASYEPLASLQGVRIGVDWRYLSEGVDESVVQAMRDGLAILRSLGAESVEVRVPDATTLIDGWAITCSVECSRAHAATYPARKDEYGPALSALLELGLRAGADQYDRLEQERSAFRAGLSDVLADVDALIAPCLPSPVPSAERTPAAEHDRAERFVRFTAPFDYSGHPSLTLPFDVDADGMPRTFQLVGRHLDEGRLLAIGSALEAAAEFSYPDVGMKP